MRTGPGGGKGAPNRSGAMMGEPLTGGTPPGDKEEKVWLNQGAGTLAGRRWEQQGSQETMRLEPEGPSETTRQEAMETPEGVRRKAEGTPEEARREQKPPRVMAKLQPTKAPATDEAELGVPQATNKVSEEGSHMTDESLQGEL